MLSSCQRQQTHRFIWISSCSLLSGIRWEDHHQKAITVLIPLFLSKSLETSHIHAQTQTHNEMQFVHYHYLAFCHGTNSYSWKAQNTYSHSEQMHKYMYVSPVSLPIIMLIIVLINRLTICCIKCQKVVKNVCVLIIFQQPQEMYSNVSFYTSSSPKPKDI